MCRLFALRSPQPATAERWLLHAPYSLLQQSRFNADGTGLGWIDADGTPRIRKRPVAAFASETFSAAAATLHSRAMIGHVRLSSGTGHSRENTHPFLQDGIISAHNGVLEVTQQMRDRVVELGAAHHVHGSTDSEWMAALITGEVAAHGGDLRRGTVAALSWIGAHVPVYSLNLLVVTAEELLAVRLPATNELWVLEPAGTRCVVIASEPMDDDPAWRPMDCGELVHVSADGTLTSEHPFGPLAQPLGIEDLGLSAAASQAHAAQARAHAERRRRSSGEAAAADAA